MSKASLNQYEQALFLHAQEGGFLIELRNGDDRIGESNVEKYRANMQTALIALLEVDLICVSLRAWKGQADTPQSLEQIKQMIANGSLWNPAEERLLYLFASELFVPVVATLPVHMQVLFRDIIQRYDAALFAKLHKTTQPTDADKEVITRILSDEFSQHLDNNDEPTEYGRKVDDLLGAFVLQWPTEAK